MLPATGHLLAAINPTVRRSVARSAKTVIALPRGGQQALGESIGASRITTNRSLQQLVGEGLIRLEADGRVRVLRPELLAARVSLI